MPGYLSQLAERAALQYVTSTSGTSLPSQSMLRNYMMRVYQQQGFSGLAANLPVDFLNSFASQAKADTSGSWLSGLIAGRADVSGSAYLALLTSDPGRTATATDLAAVEVSATGYSRQPLTFSLATSPDGGGSGISNSAAVIYGPFTGSGGLGAVVTHVALSTVPVTGGGLIAVWQLDTPVSASQNENLMLNAAGLSIGLDSWQS